jgi:hypothetical protein
MTAQGRPLRHSVTIALCATAVATSADAQPAPVPHCATLSSGILLGAACDTLADLLPVAVQFRAESADIPLVREDVEAIALGALVRTFDTGARADSAWAFAHRDTSHLWVGVEAMSATEMRATVLYWSRRPDRTLSKLCEFSGTLTVPRASIPALAAALGAEITEAARCARLEETQLDPSRVVTPPTPTPLRRMLLAALVSALLAFAGAGVLLWRHLRPRLPDFWQVAARYPDKAYDWFQSHDEWRVVDPQAGRQPRIDEREYDGPFLLWVPKLGGRRVAVYGRRTTMKESQRAFLTSRGLDSDRLP